ncbi:hypothetical protein II906_13300 [bacterium]|nr:hypothetical protein [bacterium]
MFMFLHGSKVSKNLVMQINNQKTNNRNINNKEIQNFKGAGLRGALRTLSDSNALATTICLEGAVTSGRGINAYKRGGFYEARERLTDDILAAVFWMKGVDIFNKLADKIVGKRILKLDTTEFDVGHDILRTPFKNLVENEAIKKGLSDEAKAALEKKLSAYKFTKIFASTLLAVGFVGFVLPKINQFITGKMMARDKKKKQDEKKVTAYNPLKENTMEAFTKSVKDNKNPSFGNALTTAAFMLENNAICKMMSSDVGIISGRMLTARNKDEAIEYGFRDASSSFFYYASTPLVYGLLQRITGSKKSTTIDAVTAKQLSENIKAILPKGEKMGAEEFGKKALGELSEGAKELLEKLKGSVKYSPKST